MRRQKCDRHQPCRIAWQLISPAPALVLGGQYDPSVHRRYPLSRTATHRPTAGCLEQSLNHNPSDTTGEVTTSIGSRSHTTSIASNTFRQRPSGTDRNGSQLERLQHLLPSLPVIRRLVEYHDSCISWYHWSVDALLFQKELLRTTKPDGSIRICSSNTRWVALLFAVLTASITCSDETTALSWGYSKIEKFEKSKLWYEASLVCLNESWYMSVPHIN